MYKAIIFDWGGVLHSNEMKHVYRDIQDTLKLTDEVFKKTIKELEPLLQLGKISEAEYWQEFVRLSETRQPLPSISLYAREYIKRFKVDKEMLDLIKILKQKKYKLAVLSDTIDSHKEYNEKEGLYNDFDIRVLSNEVGCKKPDPKIYKITLERLEVSPEEAIFIDDVLDYVNAANELGITGLLFTNYNKLKDDLHNLQII